MKVLFVEDDPTFRELLQNLLEREGHQVITASGGRMALEELQRNRFDTAILDIGLPDINGLILYYEIKEKYPELASKVIFLTGLPFLEKAVRKLADLGAMFLSKPVDQSTLAGALRVATGGAG